MDAPRVGALIRRAILGDESGEPERLGRVLLRPHQGDAVRQLRTALDRFGGALLADHPGMGKTFVALAVARPFGSPLVLAPSVVRREWQRSAVESATPIAFVSFEQLSRGAAPTSQCPIVVIDEAQHAGGACTRRRRAIEQLVVGRRVLLLSASPVRNRMRERDALLSLFLNTSRLRDPATVAACVVRRTRLADEMPRVVRVRTIAAPPGAVLERLISALPPAAPVRDGGVAPALVAIGLLRARSSSVAALVATVGRRLQRGAAFDAALAQGEWPDARGLSRWLAGDDALQLQLPLARDAHPDSIAWRATIAEHCHALRALLRVARAAEPRDTAARARRLAAIAARHAGVPVLAFTQHVATAECCFRALRYRPGVALLTARGARTVSGGRQRHEIIAALAPGSARTHAHDRDRDRIELLIATDLLSEGVNLQRAGVVVHLDLPWTPIALRQRLGRVARIGAEHDTVFEYTFAGSRDTRRPLALDKRHRAKAHAEAEALAPGESRERLRRALRSWPTGSDPSSGSDASDGRKDSPAEAPEEQQKTPAIATVGAGAGGFLAQLRYGDRCQLVGAVRGSTKAIVTDDDALASLVLSVDFDAGVPDRSDAAAIAQRVMRWISSRNAADALAGNASDTPLRRAMLRQLTVALRRASPREGSAAALAARSVRVALHTARGPVVERELRRLLAAPRSSDLEWMRRCETALLRFASPAQDHQEPPRLAALLLLSPAAAPSPPAPARERQGVRPATSL